MELHDKQCQPLKEETSPLSENEENEYLQKLTDWEIDRKDIHKIKKQYEFDDFDKSMEFVNKVAGIAKQEDHHPDICIQYNQVDVQISTHKINGLHENDFIVAAKIDNINSF
ncbi:4a-hydroxytetrahydrobiopterin dehydratase [candidate division KSB1 bacterium]|nr:4a-hydroxytetrahydrobiopterin dehydratase [candidate division KSB1 bacterium]